MLYAFKTAVFLFCVLLASTTFAEGKPVSKKSLKEALVLIQDANDDFDNKDYKYALEGYKEAFKIYATPVLLFRIALSNDKLGNKSEASSFYKQYLGAEKTTEKLVSKAKQRIADLKKSLPSQLLITSNPQGADVFVNDPTSEPVGQTPFTIDLKPDTYNIILKLDNYRIEMSKIKLESGKKETFHAELEPLGAKAGKFVAVETPKEINDSGILTTIGWSSIGVGSALLIGGGVFTFLSTQKENEANDYNKRASNATRQELANLRDSSTTFANTSTLFYIVGGVALAGGVSLILLDGSEESDTTLRLSPLRDGAAVGLSKTF